jgi:hypothetical protein
MQAGGLVYKSGRLVEPEHERSDDMMARKMLPVWHAACRSFLCEVRQGLLSMEITK